MNLIELDAYVEFLKAEKLEMNKPIIEFYLKKRKELVSEINQKIANIN